MKEDTFLATVAKEGDQDPFAILEKETPAVSQTETKPEEVKVEDKPQEGVNTPVKDVPFHQDPRWIRREEELKTLREQREADAKAIAELSQKTDRITSEDSKPADWFKTLYGDNPEAWQKYQEHEKETEERIERNLIEKQEKVRKEAEEESQRWTDFNEKEFLRLESQGKKFNRNELKQILLDDAPTNLETGLLDFDKGYRILSDRKELEELKSNSPEKSQARKQLADTTTKSSSTGEKPAKDYKTAAELRRTSWSAL